MFRRILCSIIILFGLCVTETYAQVSPSFTQFYINPYRINPSFAGIEGRPVVYLAHRQQWVGVEGAPVTTSFSFHAPLNFGVNLGTDIYNDNRGILSTNSFIITAGYVVSFSNKDFLRFGLSGGMGFRNIDLSQVDNPSDPALFDVVDNNLFLNGNFGVSFQTGYLTVGVAMPNLFKPNLNNTSTFENGKLAPLNEIVGNVSYRFYLALDDVAFEPHAVYRYSDVSPHQYEFAGIFHLKHVVWLGGSYRQDYGASALAGIKLKNRMLVGYSYGIGSKALPGIGSSTHEFNLSIQLGEKRRSRRRAQKVYLSFIDTERVYWDEGARRRRITGRRQSTANMYRPPARTSSTQETSTDEQKEDNMTPTVETPQHDNPRLTIGREFGGRAVSSIRTENVSAGDNPFELGKGNYIIVREFEIENTAQEYSNQLEEGGQRSGYGYVTSRAKWMVYVYRSDSKIGLRRQAEKFNSNPDFRDVWILSVE